MRILLKYCVQLVLIGAMLVPAGTGAQDSAPPVAKDFVKVSDDDVQVDFRFDKVDIRFLVKIVGEMTGRRFVIDDKVEGKITVVTPPKISKKEIYPLFLSILDSCGYGVVDKDGVGHIILRGERPTPVVPVVGPDQKTPDMGLYTKVLHISNIPVAELRTLLAPMVEGAGSGSLGTMETTNHIIITDSAESIRRIERIIREIDKPDVGRVTEIVSLKHATASDIAGELNTAIAGTAAIHGRTKGEVLQQRLRGSAKASMPMDALVVAAPHSNSLILVGTPAQVDNLKQIIAKMDVPAVSGHGRFQAIFLKYLSSEEAAKSLNSLLAKNADVPSRERIGIEPNAANNALLVDAAPQDFETIRELINQLDIPPQQVMVEVMIAEITMDSGSEYSTEMFAGGAPDEDQTTMIGGSKTDDTQSTLLNNVISGITPNGLTFGLAKGTYTDSSGNIVPRIAGLINLRALIKDGKFRVLSNIPLWAQNNQAASVSIVENIPVLTSTIQGGAGTSRDVIQNIDRIDVGIKLSVTPQVNPEDEILMKLNPSIEAVTQMRTGSMDLTPTIAKREVSTTVTVPDNETIVISGLMREDEVNSEQRVPILGSIPIIGWLFRSSTRTKRRTNLLVFVTPHIVNNSKQAAELKERFKNDELVSPWAETNSNDKASTRKTEPGN